MQEDSIKCYRNGCTGSATRQQGGDRVCQKCGLRVAETQLSAFGQPPQEPDPVAEMNAAAARSRELSY